jgi:hypothetical protein
VVQVRVGHILDRRGFLVVGVGLGSAMRELGNWCLLVSRHSVIYWLLRHVFFTYWSYS